MSPPPVIVNHLSAEIGEALLAHPCRPRVINAPEPDHPWLIDEDADILVTGSFSKWKQAPDHWRPAEKLKWVQVASTGVEVYPPRLKAGPVMTCGRGLNAVPIAEFVFAAMLRVEKKIEQTRAREEADWVHPEIGSLHGRTIGLIGYGSIGQAITSRALAFGMKVIVNRRGAWDRVPDGVTPCPSPEEVFAKADHLVIAAPLTDETHGLVNTALLSRSKPGLHLINIARGALVDQDALLAALEDGVIAEATLDVTTPEPLPDGHVLYGHPNVLISPHISWRGGDQDGMFLERLLSNLDAYVQGEPLQYRVDPVAGY